MVVNVAVLMQSSLRILFSLSAESLVECLELFCTFSVCNLRCISGAQLNPKLTDTLRDAVACT